MLRQCELRTVSRRRAFDRRRRTAPSRLRKPSDPRNAAFAPIDVRWPIVGSITLTSSSRGEIISVTGSRGALQWVTNRGEKRFVRS
jgi:hypothetical protein